jgi:hypothetical protein
MHIDCDDCVGQGTSACGDCFVTYLRDRPPGAVIVDVEHERAIRTLQEAGLTPVNRFAAS